MALPRESLYVLGMEMLTVRLSCSIDECEDAGARSPETTSEGADE